MFNDILTGKASLEPQPETVEPYRKPAELPPVPYTCVACGQASTAPAGAPRDRCPPCHVAMVEANARESALAVHQMETQARRATSSHLVVRVAIGLAIGLGIAAFKYAMREQQREDAAVGAGYKSYRDYEERDAIFPSDEYSREIRRRSDEMCRCEDLKCARDVHAQYAAYARSGAPRDDAARASVERDTVRLFECKAHFESE